MSSSKCGLRYAIAVVIIAILTLPALALAQTSMGGVSGTVKDSTGGVVPGATVRLVSEATGVVVERHTNESGFFSFVNVRPGTYNLTIELTGFNKAQVTPFSVGVNEAVSRNVTLQVGAMTETATVVSQSELLQTSSAELGNVVEERVIRDLPLQGRNFTQLLLLTPGVNPVSTAQGPQSETAVNSIEGNSGVPGGMIANASIQGQQNRSKVYYMDGIINTSVRAGSYVALPDIDSLQEFKVQSQSDKAEFGGVTGGVVNMTSKSGSNRFSGSGFGYFRNEELSARNPFRDFNVSKPPGLQSVAVRGKPRRPDLQEQDVLLRLVRRLALSRLLRREHHRSGRTRAGWGLLADLPWPHHLQPVHARGREGGRLVRDPFPGQRHPRAPDLADDAGVPEGVHGPAQCPRKRGRQLPNVARAGEQLERVPGQGGPSLLDQRQPLLPLDRAAHQRLHPEGRSRVPGAGFDQPQLRRRLVPHLLAEHDPRGARRRSDAAHRGRAVPARARRRAAAESQPARSWTASRATSSGTA